MKGTNPIPGSPIVTCLCHKRPSTPAHDDGLLLAGSVEESSLPIGGGGKGRGRDGDNSVWNTLCPGHLLQVSRANYHGGGRRLASGGQEPAEGKAEVVETGKGAGKRGCGCPELGPDILGGGTVGIVVQVRDVGDDPTHQEGV